MRAELLTRYLLGQGDTRMNTLLDRKVSKGSRLTIKDLEGEWVVLDRFETLEAREIKRGWNNNI